ncbi:hypothetical protein Wcon_00005 [Wolbachia endosymbiont of Cylisticus convexus]|uniref:hypothetical protein n=1 Tax=Wolbachia endosymbiont of Cylisticus convexus TaxID=118728 RepID=UPI000E16A557|nr:hypothetical protein [Wolbachia endosymbiont of Cylisticus convexus]RDD35710.1 hypothetical protein Wcon_00005 [Wolbachia endosymbiont of Cylisticus convexus]
MSRDISHHLISNYRIVLKVNIIPELISLFLEFTDDYFEKKGSLNQKKQPEIKTEVIHEKNGKKEIKKKKQCFSDVEDYSINQSIAQKLTDLEVKKTSTKIMPLDPYLF